MQSTVLMGTFCVVQGPCGTFPCSHRSLWALSMCSPVLMRTFHSVLHLFGSLLCGPGSLWKHSVESQTLMRTFLVVLNPHRNFLCMSWVLTKTIHGVHGSYGNLSCGSRPFVKLSVLSRVLKGQSCLFWGIIYVVPRPFGTFVRSQKRMGNLCAVLCPYGISLCGTGCLWEHFVQSLFP